MSDISTLIREAKPLYFRRKKRRQRLKVVSAIAGCFTVALLLTGMPVQHRATVDMNEFYTYLYDDSSYRMLMGENDTLMAESDWMAKEYMLAQVM